MTKLYNTSHPLAESGKPIFIPFGEWDYDATCRQRLDRAHGERIANELNARVAKGEPGIPVYQGHPDVPDLAPKYPDKGALGWVVKAGLANEGGKDGLALTVEWDRDPGKGFKWFSPYWLANERVGNCHIVAEIVSIGLVNNPNIREFRLANEAKGNTMKQEIIDLAKRFDERARLANEANFDESKHPRASDGKFTSSGGGGDGGSGRETKQDDYADHLVRQTSASGKFAGKHSPSQINKALAMLHDSHSARKSGFTGIAGSDKSDAADRKSIHAAAIRLGFKYNRATHQYE